MMQPRSHQIRSDSRLLYSKNRIAESSELRSPRRSAMLATRCTPTPKGFKLQSFAPSMARFMSTDSRHQFPGRNFIAGPAHVKMDARGLIGLGAHAGTARNQQTFQTICLGGGFGGDCSSGGPCRRPGETLEPLTFLQG